jgi:hypothetical protein
MSEKNKCRVCGTTPDHDMDACDHCDGWICDTCGINEHDECFCSQECADEYRWAHSDPDQGQEDN